MPELIQNQDTAPLKQAIVGYIFSNQYNNRDLLVCRKRTTLISLCFIL